MTYFTDTNVAVSAQPSRIAALLDTIALKMRQRKAYSQTFNELASLSTRELGDLGMCRGDVRRVAREAAELVN